MSPHLTTIEELRRYRAKISTERGKEVSLRETALSLGLKESYAASLSIILRGNEGVSTERENEIRRALQLWPLNTKCVDGIPRKILADMIRNRVEYP